MENIEIQIYKHISFHYARHTFATLALFSGIRVDVIAEILGHTDMKITNLILMYQDEFLIAEMGKFNKRLEPVKEVVKKVESKKLKQ